MVTHAVGPEYLLEAGDKLHFCGCAADATFEALWPGTAGYLL